MTRSTCRVGLAIIVLLQVFGPIGAASGVPSITIEVPLFEGGAGKDFFLQCAREYEKARPDVAVNCYLDPRIADKVQVRVLEGSFFEITNAFINYWPLIRNGDVLDVASYLDGRNWEGNARWRDTFLPGALDSYSEDGKIYGIPLPYYASVIWYNKKMFRERGWSPPRTWDELFSLCASIKRAGISPMAFQGRYPYYAQPLYDAAYYHLAGFEQWRARQLLEPGTFNSPQSVQAIELVRRLAREAFEPGAMGMDHTTSQLEFFLGHTAMIPCGTWLKSEMQGKIPDDFELGAFNIPSIQPSKGEPTACIIHAEPFFVMARSAHPKEAVDFLRFMTSRRMAGRFAHMQDIPTAIRGADEGNLSPDMDDVLKITTSAKFSFGTIPGEGFPEMQQVNTDMMYEILRDGAPPAQRVADTFERRAQDVRNLAEHPEIVKHTHVVKPILLLGLLGAGMILGIIGIAQGIKRVSVGALKAGGLQRMRPGGVLLFVAPAVLIYGAFVVFPSIRALAWSLHRWNGLTPISDMPFEGLLNFKRLLLESDGFWIALKNNLFLMLVVPLFVIPLALFLAATISRGIWGASWFRVVFFFPNLLGGVAATLLWLHLYNPQGGLINAALTAIGFSSFHGFAWLEPKNLYWALIPISVWGACGFNMVLYLAAMQNVPESLYESATIDGATAWRQFWVITLPLIWDILAISIVFLVIGGMKAFEVIWLLTNQAPQTDNHVIGTLMVQTMFKEFKVGQATAIAVLLFLMVFIGSAATLRAMRKEAVEL
jgi:raffinose/stachyose/melibiose transport system permease protein